MKRRAWNGLLRRAGKFKCARGNRLAQEEISTIAPKTVHIGTFIGHLSTIVGMIARSF